MDGIVVIMIMFISLFVVDISINLRRVNTNILKLAEQYKKVHGL